MPTGRNDPMRVLQPIVQRCRAHNRRGEQCGHAAIPGGTVCYYHGGAAAHVRDAATARLLGGTERAAAELVRLASKAKAEPVRLAACKDVLDRAGIGARGQVDVNVEATVEAPALDRLIAEVIARRSSFPQEARSLAAQGIEEAEVVDEANAAE